MPITYRDGSLDSYANELLLTYVALHRYVSEGEEEYDSDDAEDAEEEETAAAPGKPCFTIQPTGEHLVTRAIAPKTKKRKTEQPKEVDDEEEVEGDEDDEEVEGAELEDDEEEDAGQDEDEEVSAFSSTL